MALKEQVIDDLKKQLALQKAENSKLFSEN